MSWGRTLAGLSAGSTDWSPNTSCTTSRWLAQPQFVSRWSDILSGGRYRASTACLCALAPTQQKKGW